MWASSTPSASESASRKTWRAALAGLSLIAVIGMSGCSSGSTPDPQTSTGTNNAMPSAPDTVPEVNDSTDTGCSGDFSEPLTPPGWTAAVVSACVTTDQRSVLVENTSEFFLQVRAGAGSVLRPVNYAESSSLPSLLGEITAQHMDTPFGTASLPPGASVIADGLDGSPGLILIDRPDAYTVSAYAEHAVATALADRFTPNSEIYAQRASECVNDVSSAIEGAQQSDPSTSLSDLTVATMFRNGSVCTSLLHDTFNDAESAPSADTLQEELKSIGADMKATFVEDLFDLVGDVVRLH